MKPSILFAAILIAILAAAIAAVDFNGNLISLDSMDENSGFWVKFAIGKAVGAATLQQSTAESGEQIKTNP